MAFTRTTNLRLLRIGIAVVLTLVIVGYALSRSLNYARGPTIQIISPANYSGVSSSTVTITGKADRINDLTLNGGAISVDQQGNFSETVIIFPGLNKLNFVAYDQFKRSIQKELDLVGKVDFPINKSSVRNGATTSTSTSTDKTSTSTDTSSTSENL